MNILSTKTINLKHQLIPENSFFFKQQKWNKTSVISQVLLN